MLSLHSFSNPYSAEPHTLHEDYCESGIYLRSGHGRICDLGSRITFHLKLLLDLQGLGIALAANRG